MASILRTGKFVRYIAGLTRNIVFNTYRETEGNVIKHSRALCTTFSLGFPHTIQESDENLERSIRKLDQDVRRSGRISRRDIEEVLDEIRQHRTATSSQSLMVIRCCGNLVPEELPETRTSLVQEIWKTLNNLNVPMDISHYNALLRVFLENEHPFSPTDFLGDLESKGVEPNRVTYQRLISRYCQQGDIDGATRILEFMRAKQLPINEHVFNALIMGHSEADDIESAVGILSVMKQTGLEPTADTYTILLCSYAKHGKIDDILATLKKCESNDIFLLDKDFFDIIYTLSTNGYCDQVDHIIPHLRKSNGYNQDAVNLILRLVNKGQEDVAFKILKTMPRGMKSDGELTDTGIFFIRQLVKAKRPTDKIMSICKELQQEGLNNRAFLVAVETGMTSGIMDMAVPFLNELKASESPIRQHYFWPLICSQAKASTDDMLDVLRLMQSDFNITPSSETIREYVLPNMKERNYQQIITKLRVAGVSVATAVTSSVHHALTQFKMKEAAQIASSYSIYYNPSLLRRPLMDALIKSQDYVNYVSILRSVYQNIPRLQQIQNNRQDDENDLNTDGELIESNQKQSEILGQFVLDAVIYLNNSRGKVAENILSALVDQGLSMSSTYAQRIQERLGSQMNNEISSFLDKLTTGELEPVPYEKRTVRLSWDNMAADQLEQMIQRQEVKGENIKGLQKYLLLAYLKANDIEKSEALVKKLEDTDYVFSSGMYAQLIDSYCNGNVDKALEAYTKIKTKEPDFVLDDLKTIRLVHELVVNDRIDEAVDFLNANKREAKSEDEHGFGYSTTCWRILDSLAQKGKVDELQKVFECMEKNNFIEINNVLLGPLVKVHLIKNDVHKAIEVFESICTKYNCTPWKNDLACKLIEMEDATNLQRLTDLSTTIHGEVNSLYDLVFSFVECGRIRQARKILETPGLRSRPQRINFACERYRREGKAESLEGLIQATRDLNHIDRHEIFYNLLLTYIKEDQAEKALGLWEKIQEEEDVAPTAQFLTTLAKYLTTKGVDVPFVIPSLAIKSDTEKKERISSIPDGTTKGKEKSETVPNESIILETMVKNNRLEDATAQIKKMIHSNKFPLTRVFRFYLNKIAETGNYLVLEELSKSLSPDLRKTLSFDNRICNAYAAAGKSAELLDQIEKKFDKATTADELNLLAQEFPKGGFIGVLDKHPEFLSTFEKFANKLAERGIYTPINTLWMNYVINEKLELADNIMKNHLNNSPQLMFQSIIGAVHSKRDEKLAQNLLNAMKESKCSERGWGLAHSCLIDVLCAQSRFDDALKALDNAINDVCLENINRTALMRVKNGLEKAGKKFPYSIPEKTTRGNVADSSSSSSSSSDDEPPVKK